MFLSSHLFRMPRCSSTIELFAFHNWTLGVLPINQFYIYLSQSGIFNFRHLFFSICFYQIYKDVCHLLSSAYCQNIYINFCKVTSFSKMGYYLIKQWLAQCRAIFCSLFFIFIDCLFLSLAIQYFNIIQFSTKAQENMNQ